ncbi:hypothetical protein BDZ91DRAFT_684137, partial [Kalaharituber pfeilii]
MVAINYARKRLIVRCSPADVNHVRILLYRPRPRRAEAAPSGQEEPCPVCMEPAEPPVVRTGCGHTYCKSCIRDYIRASIDGHKFPIACFHASGGAECSAPISISTIQELLPTSDADQLFEASFSSYVQARPQQYSYCPTPDCSTVYLVTLLESVFTCSQCFLGICTACQRPAHHGQTCTQHRAAIDGKEEFEHWKAHAGVKRCPKCHVDIEKKDGCNHMTCKCGAHLCWSCMREFPRGTIYAHMR